MFYINNIKIIRFTGMIPKHAFLSWLVALDRLSTRDRMRLGGLLSLLCASSVAVLMSAGNTYSSTVLTVRRFGNFSTLDSIFLLLICSKMDSDGSVGPLRIIISTSSFVSPFKLLSTCYGRRGTQGFTPRSLDLLLFLLLRFSVWFAQNWTHYRGLSDIDHRLSPSFLPGSRSFRLQRLCCFVFLFCFVMLTINK